MAEVEISQATDDALARPTYVRDNARRTNGEEYGMSTTMERVLERAVPVVDNRSWLRWGTGTFLAVESVHLVTGMLINDWEGWGVFFENFSFVAVTGVLLMALVYGLLVRWALKPSPGQRNRPASASLVTGLLSLAGYLAFFLWAHLLIAPAAVLLGRAGLMRAEAGGGRAPALAGITMGIASLTFGVVFLVYVLLNGHYPQFLGG